MLTLDRNVLFVEQCLEPFITGFHIQQHSVIEAVISSIFLFVQHKLKYKKKMLGICQFYHFLVRHYGPSHVDT